MITRKDYIAIAQILYEWYAGDGAGNECCNITASCIACSIAGYFEDKHPGFDCERFLEICKTGVKTND